MTWVIFTWGISIGTSPNSRHDRIADERSPQLWLLSRHGSVRSRDHEAETWCRLVWPYAVDLELSGRVQRCPVIAHVIADVDALNVLKSLVSESYRLNLGRRLAGHLVRLSGRALLGAKLPCVLSPPSGHLPHPRCQATLSEYR